MAPNAIGQRVKVAIPQPNIEPTETPPTNGGYSSDKNTNNGHETGFNIINFIFDIFIDKKPVGFCFIEKYKTKLDLKIEAPLLYYPFLFLSIILDLAQAIVSLVFMFAILLIITLTFARGVGVFDWLPGIVNAIK